MKRVAPSPAPVSETPLRQAVVAPAMRYAPGGQKMTRGRPSALHARPSSSTSAASAG
jgi:hypothetical protein